MFNTTNVQKKHLNKIVSHDELRPVMMGVFLDTKAERLVATDAHKLLFYEVELSGTESDAVIPIDAFDVTCLKKRMGLDAKDLKERPFKYQVTEKETRVLHKNSEIEVPFENIEGNYPNWRPAIPEGPGSLEGGKVGFNSTKFRELMGGIPDDRNIIFKFFAPSKGVYLQTSKHHEDSGRIEGLIMPTLFDANEHDME